MPLSLIGAIRSYHAHIYYRDELEKARAETLRAQIDERFSVRLGRWHDKPIGPHAHAMYQVAFSTEVFARFIPWLMLNRAGLTILIHPNTDNPRADHLFHAFWMGEILPIVRPEQLPESLSGDEDEPELPNSSPRLPA